jgi:hypothetical protein
MEKSFSFEDRTPPDAGFGLFRWDLWTLEKTRLGLQNGSVLRKPAFEFG